MRVFLADENLDAIIIEAMRLARFEVHAIAEISPGAKDDEVLHLAVEHDALLVTEDKDFGELVYRIGRASSGVLLVRLAGMPLARKAALVVATLNHHAEDLHGAFSVLGRRSLRIRRGIWSK